MSVNYKKALGYTLLGTGAAILVYQPFAFADVPLAESLDVPGLSFTAGTAVGTASLSNSSAMSFSVPDTILDQEYEVRFDRFESAYTVVRSS